MVIVVSGGISALTVLAFVALILWWIARNPANAERIAFWFYSAGRWASKSAANRALQRDITHRINDFAVRIRGEIHGYEPRGLELSIVDAETTSEAFMDLGKLVVRLRPRPGRDQNFLTVARLYIAHTVFPEVKHHLRENQRHAIDLRITEKMVRLERQDLVPEFIRSWLNPAIARNKPLEQLIAELGVIDRAGVFIPVLCQELHFMGARLLGSVNREALRTEVQRFTGFLHTIARRRTGEEVPLEYHGPFLRVLVVIVSRSILREAVRGQPGPWVRFARDAVARRPIEHVYFVGSPVRENRTLMKRVAEAFCSGSGWRQVCERLYACELLDADGAPYQTRDFMIVCGRGPTETTSEILEPLIS